MQREPRRSGLARSVQLRLTGCHGFCERGTAGGARVRTRLLYQKVKPEDVPEILEKTVTEGEILERLLSSRTMAATSTCEGQAPVLQATRTRLLLAYQRRIDPTDIDDYIAAGGYSAAGQGARTMTTRAGCRADHRKRSARPRRRRFPDRGQVARAAACAVPDDVRYVICNARRGRPGRLHGPLPHGGQSALGDRGHDHRRLRHRDPGRARGLRLRPQRVPAGGRERSPMRPRAGPRDGPAGPGHPRHRLRLRHPDQPRRRRLRVRRVHRADGLHRGRCGRAAGQVHPHGRVRPARQAHQTSTTSRPGPTCRSSSTAGRTGSPRSAPGT